MLDFRSSLIEDFNKVIIEKDSSLSSGINSNDTKDYSIYSILNSSNLTSKELDKLRITSYNKTSIQHKTKLKPRTIISYLVFGATLIGSLALLTVSTAFWLPVLISILFIFFTWVNNASKSKIRKINIHNFDNEDFKWNTEKPLKQKRTINTGNFVFETGTKDWCYWENININLPENYEISLKSKWVKGAYSPYGVTLTDKNANFISFEVVGKKKGQYNIWHDNVYAISPNLKSGFPSTTDESLQLVSVRGEDFEYTINNKIAFTEKIALISKPTQIGIRVCNVQTVEFSELQVKNSDTGEIILKDNFNPKLTKFTEETELEYETATKAEGYYFEGMTTDWCNWAYKYVSLSGDCEFFLTAKWLEGEDAGFGLSIYETEQSYSFFRILRAGLAGVDVFDGKLYTEAEENFNTNFTLIPQTSVQLGYVDNNLSVLKN